LVGASAALMGTYLCLKHEHLVGASAILNGHIFVPVACADAACISRSQSRSRSRSLYFSASNGELLSHSCVDDCFIIVQPRLAEFSCGWVRLVRWCRLTLSSVTSPSG
jgi:hypothetical protein